MKEQNSKNKLVGTIILILALAFIFLVSLTNLFQTNYGMGMMNWNYGGYFGMMGIFRTTIGVLVVIILVLIIFLLDKQLKK